MPKSPAIQPALDKFGGDYSKLASAILPAVRQQIKSGASATVAVERVFRSLGVKEKISTTITDGILFAVDKGLDRFARVVDPEGLRQWFLQKHWKGEALTLSQRINRMEMKSVMTNTIRRSMKAGDSWGTLARSITEKQLVKGDVAGHIWDTIKQGRKVMKGDTTAIRAMQSSLRKSQRQIERLAQNGAPTGALKKAYANVLRVVDQGKADALDKAIGRAVNAKARYNAERIARTEMARAYAKGTESRLALDEDAVGYKSELSSRHPTTDICDFYAEADLYEMGPGVFPKDVEPEVPYHPHCTCNLTAVYRTPPGGGKFRASAGKEYLDAQPEETRKALLGAENADKTKGWEKKLRQWSRPVNPRESLPLEFLQKTDVGDRMGMAATKTISPPASVPRFTSNSQAEQWVSKNQLARKAAFKDFDVGVTQVLVDELQSTVEKFPIMKGQLEFIGSSKEFARLYKRTVPSENIFALAHPRVSGTRMALTLSDDVAQNLDRLEAIARREERSGFHAASSGSAKGVIDHEIGHLLDFRTSLTATDRDLKAYWNSLSADDISKGLSGYGTQGGVKEFLAEGYTEYVNARAPRPISQKLGELLEKRIKLVEEFKQKRR